MEQSELVLGTVMKELYSQAIYLEGCLLSTNMVTPGKQSADA